MKHAIVIAATAFTLAGCQTTFQQVGMFDARLKDKCAYLLSGAQIAQLGAQLFVPNAANVANAANALLADYCTSKPIDNPIAALDAMERVIVAVRPIAAKVK